jgi:hypothetical protein
MKATAYSLGLEWRKIEVEESPKCFMCHEQIFGNVWKMFTVSKADGMTTAACASEFIICDACHELLEGS